MKPAIGNYAAKVLKLGLFLLLWICLCKYWFLLSPNSPLRWIPESWTLWFYDLLGVSCCEEAADADIIMALLLSAPLAWVSVWFFWRLVSWLRKSA